MSPAEPYYAHRAAQKTKKAAPEAANKSGLRGAAQATREPEHGAHGGGLSEQDKMVQALF